jgi:hypothetical protein
MTNTAAATRMPHAPRRRPQGPAAAILRYDHTHGSEDAS